MSTPSYSYVRLTAQGLISGVQSWSFGLSVLVGGGSVSQAQLNSLLASFQTAVETWWGSSAGGGLAGLNTNDTTLTGYRAYLYGFSGGPAILQAAIDRSTALVGSGSTPAPTQTAIVATLLTGLPGRSFRGRIYAPMTAAPLSANHQLTQTLATNIAQRVAAMITAVNGAATLPSFSGVIVAGSQGPIPVTSVRVDSEPDIQRRRADKIIAAFRGVANV